MKKKLLKSVLLAGVVLAVSCNKEDVDKFADSVTAVLEKLKKVEFPQEAPVIIETTDDYVVRGQYKTLITERKQVLLNPAELVNDQNIDVIFPGSVLRGDSFLEGKYDPVVITGPKEITFSASLQGKGLEVKKQAIPILSDVRQKINDLIKDNTEKIDYKNAPTYLTYLAESVGSVESFNKVFRMHVGVEVMKKLVDVDFNYNPRQFRIEGKNYVLIKVRQPLYNIAVDPKEAKDWGEFKNLGEVEPVYVSSVDYGRVAHLLIETDVVAKDVIKYVDGSVKVDVLKVDVDVNGTYSEQMIKWFKQGKIAVLAAGGPLSLGNKIDSYDAFIAFLKDPDAESLINSAVPIGYKVRTLKDNKEVEIRRAVIDQYFQ